MAVYTTIDDPSAHFQIATYTGDGNDDRAITNDGNSNLQPDLIWFKNRSTTNSHNLLDSTRGITKRLRSDDASTEATVSTRLKSFDSDGMTISTDPSVNGNTNGIVAWQWKANGGTRTTFTENGNNPAGGYQANTTAGFSIVDFTGTDAAGTIAHGLGAVPNVMIVKGRSTGAHWTVYHSENTSAPETDRLKLNDTNATADYDGWWNDTAPTSSVFTVGGDDNTNLDDATYIAYLWTEVQGYSKFGSYKGNENNGDGTFVYTGFSPAFVMVKNTERAQNWSMHSNEIPGYNGDNKRLQANLNSAEATNNMVDLLSNGFKWRTNDGDTNGYVQIHTYLAFAHQPFVTSTGIPATAV